MVQARVGRSVRVVPRPLAAARLAQHCVQATGPSRCPFASLRVRAPAQRLTPALGSLAVGWGKEGGEGKAGGTASEGGLVILGVLKKSAGPGPARLVVKPGGVAG